MRSAEDRIAPFELRIGSTLWRRVIDHLVGAAPAEGVGLLAGRGGRGSVEATEFFPGTNLDASPTRYTMDPGQVIAAFGELDARGWDLAAIVHSHPATPPVPSVTDLHDANYPEALLLIVGLASTPPVARAWRLTRPAGYDAAGAAVAGEARLLVGDDAPTRRTGKMTAERFREGAW